jgi:hypothetical protein
MLLAFFGRLPSDVAVNVGSPVKAPMVQRAEISKTTGRSGSREDEVIQSQLDPAIVTSGSCGPPPALRRMRVILFEDVDTVFDEDFGFSKALALLSETSKCPIILTSNSKSHGSYLSAGFLSEEASSVFIPSSQTPFFLQLSQSSAL